MLYLFWKQQPAFCAVMGQATYMQQLVALLRRNWMFKLRTGKTTLQVCRIIALHSAFWAFHMQTWCSTARVDWLSLWCCLLNNLIVHTVLFSPASSIKALKDWQLFAREGFPNSHDSCFCQFCKMLKAFLINSRAQWIFAYSFVLIFATDLPSHFFQLIYS